MTDLRTEVARAIADYTLDTRWSPGGVADAVIPIVRKHVLEEGWSAGWDDCKACLTANEQASLTDDVKADIWADADVRDYLMKEGV